MFSKPPPLAAAKALKALEFRLALGVDLAAVEFSALLLVADDLVGGIDLGKLRLRLLVPGVLVGVVLLGELPIGALDLGLARGAADSEHVIGIAHSQFIRREDSKGMIRRDMGGKPRKCQYGVEIPRYD